MTASIKPIREWFGAMKVKDISLYSIINEKFKPIMSLGADESKLT